MLQREYPIIIWFSWSNLWDLRNVLDINSNKADTHVNLIKILTLKLISKNVFSNKHYK